MTRPGAVDLNDLLVFAAVAETGSFTAAADRLDSSKAQVSLQVKRLEAALGCELFHRTTRRITLTDPGAALLAQSVPRLREAMDALNAVPGVTSALSGSLRISCTVEHAVQSLARDVVAFSALHPQVQIDMRSSDRVVDMVRDGIDVALRMGWLSDSSLRAVKLGSFRQIVVTSPAYLKRAGTPARPEDLAGHDWIALTLLPSPLTWHFTDRRGDTITVRMRAALRTDSSGSVRSLVEAGGGIAVVGEPGARTLLREGRLVQLLTRWTLPEGGMYAVFPPGRHVPRHVQAFVDFHRERLARA